MLTENVQLLATLNFEQLFSITGHAGKAGDCIAENVGQVLINIEPTRGTLMKKGEYLNIYKCCKL